MWENRWRPESDQRLSDAERENFLATEEVAALCRHQSGDVNEAIARFRNLDEIASHANKLRDGFFVVDETGTYPDRWYRRKSEREHQPERSQ